MTEYEKDAVASEAPPEDVEPPRPPRPVPCSGLFGISARQAEDIAHSHCDRLTVPPFPWHPRSL